MKTFVYSAKDAASLSKSGSIEAPDERTAAFTLRQHGLIPISIKVRSENLGLKLIATLFSRVSHGELVNFTRQLATMIAAGLTLPDALVILQKQMTNRQFQQILSDVLRNVEGGSSLASALAKHQQLFGKIYIELIRAGESAGVLDNVLNRLADNLEKEREFRSKTRGALIYPAIVLAAMGLVVFVMMVFVIPKLTDLYKEFGASLPLPTRILITISGLSRRFWWLVIAIVVGSIVLLRRYSKSEIGKKQLDAVILRLPVWGKIRQNVILAEFSRTLGLLIGAGIPILDALKIVAGAVDNAVFEQAILTSAKQVERGFPLGVPLSQQKVFPPIVSQMVKTGEETGKLDDVLSKVSHYFESESEHAVKNLTTALEPIILIILAVGVAFLIISIILPIYSLTSQF